MTVTINRKTYEYMYRSEDPINLKIINTIVKKNKDGYIVDLDRIIRIRNSRLLLRIESISKMIEFNML